MAKQMLTLDELTFPKFSKNSSKKNFRLIFFIQYRDSKGELTTKMFSKPDSGEWQWKDDEDDYFIPAKQNQPVADSIELDLSCLKSNDNSFTELDYQITEIDGKLEAVTVHVLDVFDKSFLDVLLKVLSRVLEDLAKLGLGALPIPGTLTGIISKGINAKDLADRVEAELKEKKKDKLLFRGAKKFNDEEKVIITGRKKWEDNKEGTYKILVGFE